jgi:hypothetical protein
MSLAIVHSRAQVGVGAPAVTVEAHLANGLPALTLVGLPEASLSKRIIKHFVKSFAVVFDHAFKRVDQLESR